MAAPHPRDLKRALRALAAGMLAGFAAPGVQGGPFVPGSSAEPLFPVAFDDPLIEAWASGFIDYAVGAEVDADFQTPARALGAAAPSDPSDIVSLGRGGRITLTFDRPIADGPGTDFAVFENGFEAAAGQFFLELAWVEVSSDGVDFFRFPNQSQVPAPIASFGTLDPTDVTGLAGKYPAGQGTPFDLSVLASTPLDVMDVRYVRIVDIVGDGTARDSLGQPIYDPAGTVISAGFDLDAVAVLNRGEAGSAPAQRPVPLGPMSLLLAPLFLVIGTYRRSAAVRPPPEKKTTSEKGMERPKRKRAS